MRKRRALSKITSPPDPVHVLDVKVLGRCQRRVLRQYRKIRKVGAEDCKSGRIVHGWRALQVTLDLPNVNTAWLFVYRNEIPPDTPTRIKLGIPRGILPSEKPPRKERPPRPKIGFEDWQKFFFKLLKVNKHQNKLEDKDNDRT
jgi:hypothetical protein